MATNHLAVCSHDLFVCAVGERDRQGKLSYRKDLLTAQPSWSRAKSLQSRPPRATPWTVVRQAPLSMGILQARILEWVAISSSRGSSQPRDQTHISCVFFIGRILYRWATWAAHDPLINISKWINGNFALQPSENLAPVCETDRLPDGEKLWGWIFTRTPINLSLSYWNKRLWHPTNFINT